MNPEAVRIIGLRVVMLAGLVILAGRLAQLQWVEELRWSDRAHNNVVRQRVIPAERGRLLDRNGIVLAGNLPAYAVYFTPALAGPNPQRVFEELQTLLPLRISDAERLRERVAGAKGGEAHQAILIRVPVERTHMVAVEAALWRLPGVSVERTWRRHYPLGDLFAQQVGYVGRPARVAAGISGGFVEGKAGLERVFDGRLRGKDGLERRIVDALGRPVVGAGASSNMAHGERGAMGLAAYDGFPLDTPARRGADVVLSYDARLQRRAAELFNHVAGAVVMIDVTNGEVLVQLSRPGFDPNQMVGGIDIARWAMLREDDLQPLLDKTLQAAFFPGSVFKPLTQIAADMEGVRPGTGERVVCSGHYGVGIRSFGCWERKGHGGVNAERAMAVSCDVWFYALGEKLGPERMALWARRFGFGEPTGGDWGDEASGVIPDRERHRKVHKRPWSTGDSVMSAIGQGDVTATPMQIALFYAALADRGRLWRPRVADRVVAADGALLEVFPRTVRRQVELPIWVWRNLQRSMEAVLNSPEGTARRHRLKGLAVAGKTGTAQVKTLDRGTPKGKIIEFRHRDHGLFAAFAPANDPRVAVVVIEEHGQSGANAAAPAMGLLRYWQELQTADAHALGTQGTP